MLPKQLIMSAFGPYKSITSINFTELAEYQLFLITGPTGAGKTTIFDALVYALYGQVSGSSRREDELKSQFATDMDLAYVQLTFEMGGKKYEIYRQPAQQGPGKSKRSRKYAAEVRFSTPDHIYTKISEANAAIQDVIGLSVDQFTRIVMLPQGEFKQLLEASSKDKQEIFRKIFDTNILKAFEAKLKEAAAETKQETDQLHRTLSDYRTELLEFVRDSPEQDTVLSWYDQEQYSQVTAWIALQLEQRADMQADLLDKLAEARQQAERFAANRQLLQTQQSLSTREKQLADEAPMMAKLKAEAATYRNTLTTYRTLQMIQQIEANQQKQLTVVQNTEENLAEVRQAQAALKAEAAEWQPQLAQLPALHKQIRELEAAKHHWEIYTQQQQQAADLALQVQQIDEEKCRLEQQIDELAILLTDADSQLEVLDEKVAQLDKLKAEAVAHEQQQRNLDGQKNQLAKIQQLEKAIADATRHYHIIFEQWQQQKQAVCRLEETYQHNLAGVLAQNLVAGSPCPVCGSTSHPQTAVLAQTEVTKEQLAAEREEESRLFGEITGISTRLNHLKTQTTQILQEMDWLTNPTETIAAELEQAQAALTNRATQLARQLTEVAVHQVEQAQLLAQREDWQEQLQQLKELQSALSGQAVSLNMQLKHAHQAVVEQAATLIGDSLFTVSEQLTATEKQIADFEAKKQDLAAKENHLQQQDILYTERLKAYKAQLAEIVQQITVNAAELNRTLVEYQLDIEQLQGIHEQEIDWHEIDGRIQAFTNQQYTLNIQLAENRQLCEENQVDQTEEDYTAAIQQLAIEQALLQAERDAQLAESSALEKLNGRLSTTVAAYQQRAAEFSELKTLSEIANGTLKGSAYISFERYVLAIYFEEIIEMANLRFRQMTNGRFEFRRVTGEQKGGGAKGLDLSVYDYFAGGERSVQSLSGGEGFKASLALALGLSDVMQNYAGGVEVSTLFIDEGFGTLDQESLQQAIQTLIQLQQDSGRLIGIISHVEELKQQIPVHLEISTTNEGSTCQFTGF